MYWLEVVTFNHDPKHSRWWQRPPGRRCRSGRSYQWTAPRSCCDSSVREKERWTTSSHVRQPAYPPQPPNHHLIQTIYSLLNHHLIQTIDSPLNHHLIQTINLLNHHLIQTINLLNHNLIQTILNHHLIQTINLLNHHLIQTINLLNHHRIQTICLLNHHFITAGPSLLALSKSKEYIYILFFFKITLICVWTHLNKKWGHETTWHEEEVIERKDLRMYFLRSGMLVCTV